FGRQHCKGYRRTYIDSEGHRFTFVQARCSIWNDKLEQLHESLRLDDVLDRLKISYNALEYEAQQIFLDIAYFFIGTNKEIPSYMWSDCKYYPTSNINILIQRSMVKVGDNGKFQMHDQLRDMGREILRREDIDRPWMRSRIWSTSEVIELLLNKTSSESTFSKNFWSRRLDEDDE
ncbi:Disease resistance protein L6, partial [Linum grandiflorum]